MSKKKKGKNSGSKRPIAVTVTSTVIFILFFIRIYQAVIPLIREDFFRFRDSPCRFFTMEI